MNTYSVYAHVSPSNKVYTGITNKNPIYRWNKGNGYKRNPKFYNAILKYGWNNFEHLILISNISKTKAFNLEKALIKFHKRLNLSYNITDGGEGGRLGYSIKLTPEWKNKLSKSHTGLFHSLETRAKMSLSRKGKSQNKEWVTKRMLSHNKPIEVFIDNEWIYYKSITEASNSLNIERNNISSVCRGKRKTAGGLKFRFYDHNRI